MRLFPLYKFVIMKQVKESRLIALCFLNHIDSTWSFEIYLLKSPGSLNWVKLAVRSFPGFSYLQAYC